MDLNFTFKLGDHRTIIKADRFDVNHTEEPGRLQSMGS